MAEIKQVPGTDMDVIEHKDGSVTVRRPKGRKHHGMTVLLEPDDLVREQAKGFTNFLREYAVVGLAVGFVVGQQANAVVKQLVASFLDPVVKVWFGQNLSSRVTHWHHNQQVVTVPWGAFVFTLIEFFIVLIAIYLLIKLFRLDRFRKVPQKK